jgi:anti-anti-sigma factor
MAAPHGILRVHQQGPTVIFQVEQWGRMSQGLALRRVAEQALAGGAKNLQVDLSHCTYMDSTFVGTLLFCHRAVRRRGQGEFGLVAPSPQCRQLLQQMGVENVFAIGSEHNVPTQGWTEVCDAVDDAAACKRNVVQAHLELAEVPGPGGEPFRKVARCLQEDPSLGPGGGR